MEKTYKSLCWEDVNVNDDVPPVSMPVTITRLVIAAGGERDFAPIHHDVENTPKTGNRTAFVNTAFQQVFLNRVVNDWMGPQGKLKKLRISMRAPIYAGTTMSGSGKVIAKRQEDGQNLIDLSLAINSDDGMCTDASATVALPMKGSK